MHGPRSPERDALLAAARATAEIVERDAEQAERDGTLTPATVEALKQAGVFRAFLPAELGGVGADPLTLIELVEEVARQDGSAGWCVGTGGIISGIASAMLETEAAQTVFKDPTTICAGGFPPQGRADAVDGGYRVSGRFRFGSGCRHAAWMVLSCIEFEDAEPLKAESGLPATRSFCVPRERVVIHDNWHAAGLEGTASCDYSLDDEFVPANFSFSIERDAPRRGAPLYSLPTLSIAAFPHSGFALGVGKRALEEIGVFALSRQRLGSASPLAQRAVFQNGFAQAQTRLRAARLLAFESYGAMWSTHSSGQPLSLAQRADGAAATTYAYNVSVEVAEFAFRAAGGAALYRDQRLQRCFRDIQAGAQHIVPSEETWERVGQVQLGVGTPGMI